MPKVKDFLNIMKPHKEIYFNLSVTQKADIKKQYGYLKKHGNKDTIIQPWSISKPDCAAMWNTYTQLIINHIKH